MGKKNQKKVLGSLPLRFAACYGLVAALISGCQSELSEHLQSGQVLALYGLEGRWVGPVTPVGNACGPATQGLMTIGEKGFGFDPFGSTTVLHGDVSKDGHLTGRLVREGSEHKDYAIAFDGAAEAGTINGTLQSGRCRWAVALHRG